MGDCVFCKIVDGEEPATVLDQWVKAIAIKPLNPVVDGHVLIIPRRHVENYMTRPDVSAATMAAAADFAYTHQIGPSNIITSAGREATQSVFHLHLHIVPRAENDGLALPWYSGKSKTAAAKTIEPELNADWSELDKLRWHAGAFEARTGIRIEITTGCSSINGRVQWHLFGYTIRDTHGDFVSSGGPMDFDQMWSWLNGIEQGFKIGKWADA